MYRDNHPKVENTLSPIIASLYCPTMRILVANDMLMTLVRRENLLHSGI